MPKRFLRDEDGQIAELYRAGRTTYEIGATFGISAKAVTNALHRQEVPLRRGGTIRTWLMPTERRDEAIRPYQSGASVCDIAAHLGCRTDYVTGVLSDADIPRRPFGHANNLYNEAQAERVAAEYRAGDTQRALARRHGVSAPTIKSWLHRMNVEIRPQNAPTFWTPERVAEAAERYRRGESAEKIASDMGVSQAGVAYSLEKAGVSRRHPAKRREQSHSWKGGRIRLGAYIATWPSAGDLKLIKPLANGYVMEHRLVMARHLGRPLLPGETVHHKDGDPVHNAIGNLQLRQGKHGRGAVVACMDCGSSNIGYADL
jgi:transposase-like protein